ncbi:MAG: alkyl sulfatase dimerization domain-containing protein [Desulfatirhabdiaceae bacterium]
MKKGLFLCGLFIIFVLVSPAAAFEPAVVGVHPEIDSKYQAFFPAEVFTVTDGVYVARGYNRDNPVLIVGDDGLIVVDPGESIEAGEEVKKAFNAKLDNIFDKKPVKAVIYTHSHDCHINGAAAFADENTQIISHENFMKTLYNEWYGQVFPSRMEGAVKMLGIMYQEETDYWYRGYILGGKETLGSSGFLPPTMTVKDQLEIQIAGVDLKLIYAPAETNDVIFVWLPGKEVVLEIGILYESFPAMVTMRGSSQRNPLDYISSLKRLRSLNAQYLVALHGPNPITAGEGNVRQYLTDFSDAIQFVHDQTLQYMNRGYSPGEMKDLIKLPPNLAASPYLKETYGKIDWNIYHIFRYYRGYYTDNIRDLFPQSPLSQAQMAAELAGGVDALAGKAQQALSDKPEWALELADDVLLLDPGNTSAFETKKSAMLQLAGTTMNSQARNMLLSEYLLFDGQNQKPFPFGKPTAIYSTIKDNVVQWMPMDTALRIMSVNINASKALNNDTAPVLLLTDVSDGQYYYFMYVRNGILEVNPPDLDYCDFAIITDSLTWKNMVLGKLDPVTAIQDNNVMISGATNDKFYQFMDLFYCQ